MKVLTNESSVIDLFFEAWFSDVGAKRNITFVRHPVLGLHVMNEALTILELAVTELAFSWVLQFSVFCFFLLSNAFFPSVLSLFTLKFPNKCHI